MAWRHRLALMCAMFAALAVQARAEPPAPQLLEGTAGAAPIVMKLEVDGASAFGTYFYRRTLFDIALDGEVRAGALHLSARLTGDKLRLTPSKDGYDGLLTTARGRVVPVVLRRARNAGLLPMGGELEPFERLRLADLELKPLKTENVSGRRIRWMVDPRSGIALFRLEGGYPPSVISAVNRGLEQAHWKRVTSYFGCPDTEGHGGFENSPPQQLYFSDAYVSFAWPAGWSCAGAAHPDFGLEAHTFDARTGRELSLDDVLRFGPATPPEADSDAWMDYRSNVFAPGVVALLKRLHPGEMKKPASEDDCDYTEAGVWDFPAWHITRQGLYLGAYFARAARVCDSPEWSFIPHSALGARPVSP